MAVNKETISVFFKGLKDSAEKHAPGIFIGIGLAGMFCAGIMAVSVTPKAIRAIDDREIKEDKRLNKKEVFITCWKLYIPSVITATLSAGCVVYGGSMFHKRNVALATAYTLSEEALRRYQAKTLEVVGPKKETAIRDGIRKDIIDQHPMTEQQEKEILFDGVDEYPCYDVFSGRYFKGNIVDIRLAIQTLNQRLKSSGDFIPLNELYSLLGLNPIKLGEDLGWQFDGERYKDQLDEAMLGSQLMKNGTPCLVIDFGDTISPHYV
jgi:hypothetical protein